jgi:hypothetical protein
MSDEADLDDGEESARGVIISETITEPIAGIEVKPGIYPGVPFEDYARWNALNHSKLKHYAKTPRHARDAMLHDSESTKYQDLGHAVHQALLEPELFDELYIVAPKVDKRFKVGKAVWAEFEQRAAGRTIVTQDDMDMMRGLLHNIAGHETAREALYGVGVSELSIVWEDPEFGILCKARIDRLCEIGGWPFVVDLKTSHKIASLPTWQQSVEKYVMHEQAAHYLRGLSTLRPLEGDAVRKFAWLVCETQRPYCVRVFEAEDEALKIGNDEVGRHLAIHRQCTDSGAWPAWPEGLELAGLPSWAYKRYNAD